MPELAEQAEELNDLPWWVRGRYMLSASLSSGVLHVVLLLLMALYVFPIRPEEPAIALTLETDVPEAQPVEIASPFSLTPQLQEAADPVPTDAAMPAEKIVDDPSPVELKIDTRDLVLASEAAEFLGNLPQQGEFSGRTEKGRAALARAFGGTAASEKAVSDGLEWLKRHQRPDGSWSFDHRCPKCDDSCSSPGELGNASLAATAMAMLCFVGAGHTHEKGAYQRQMADGLEYVLAQAAAAPTPGDLRQTASGNAGMYTQGLVTILLCELYGLTKDKDVGRVALAAIRFIVEAQHPKTGGWRYQPGDEQGDTSVVGWQIMAETSARMSRLTVSARSRKLAEKFLDSVQLENGAYYGYTAPQKKASTTAIGLLCRMYQGWGKDHPGLQTGVQYLSGLGPARDDMYYNYYATQVMRHWGGEEWVKWNAVMREMLVRSQTQEGHSQGSWFPADPHGRQGGRHYMTCLAILTLEVYYRHLPIYQQRSVELEPTEK